MATEVAESNGEGYRAGFVGRSERKALRVGGAHFSFLFH
jgi:hypothetical protein